MHRLLRFGLVAYWIVALYAPMLAQTPAQHEQHHAATPQTPAAPPTSPPASPNTATPAGMGAGGMMGSMGSPPPVSLYPSLMAVPELTPEQRSEFERAGRERMAAGTAQMSAALERLTSATESGDYAAMQEATAVMREGQAQFDRGLSLRRALAEGHAPRDIALDWFRREMSLTPLPVTDTPHGFFGLS